MASRAIEILLATGFVAATSSLAVAQESPVREGQVILNKNCSMCHATGPTGASPHRQAPPFRILSQRYPIDDLQEALGEGLSSGHPDMPDFVFPPDQVGAILAYLKSIQTH